METSFNVVVFDELLGRALEGLIYRFLPEKNVVLYRHGDLSNLSSECLDADLWIIQALSWSIGLLNTDGFHLGRILAKSGHRTLLLFSLAKSSNFPLHGQFWATLLPSLDIIAGIQDVLMDPPAKSEDYDLISAQWPSLQERNLFHG